MTNIIPMTNMGNEWLIYPMDYGDYIHQPIVNIWLIYGNQYFHKVVPPPSYVCWLLIPMNTIDITPIHQPKREIVLTNQLNANYGWYMVDIWVRCG